MQKDFYQQIIKIIKNLIMKSLNNNKNKILNQKMIPCYLNYQTLKIPMEAEHNIRNFYLIELI